MVVVTMKAHEVPRDRVERKREKRILRPKRYGIPAKKPKPHTNGEEEAGGAHGKTSQTDKKRTTRIQNHESPQFLLAHCR